MIDITTPITVRTTRTKNTRPSASGPSEERVKAQLQQTEKPTVSLPALPAREEDPYDADTELDSDVTMETVPKNEPSKQSDSSPPRKGTINITQHTLKKKKTSRKYRCRECSLVLSSVQELTIHHQTNHDTLHCPKCTRPFNNPMALARHKYEHKRKDLKCPKCPKTFTFESQAKAHMYFHRSKLSYICVYPKCGRSFFKESDLTRHSKRHNGKLYKCNDCTYSDSDKRNYDSHRLSHSRITKYKCEACNQEFVFNTQKRRHQKDGKCPIKRSGSPTY